MYHPFIESVALTLVDIPITLVNTIIFGVLIYFIVGLQQTAAQFLYVHLILPCSRINLVSMQYILSVLVHHDTHHEGLVPRNCCDIQE